METTFPPSYKFPFKYTVGTKVITPEGLMEITAQFSKTKTATGWMPLYTCGFLKKDGTLDRRKRIGEHKRRYYEIDINPLPSYYNGKPCCAEFNIASGNSDAHCFRTRTSYALKLLKKNPLLCYNCLYNIKVN